MILPDPLFPKQHAFGADDGRPHLVPDLDPVLQMGHFSRALLDHFCLAPKGVWHVDRRELIECPGIGDQGCESYDS
jgi:hypothetical protein